MKLPDRTLLVLALLLPLGLGSCGVEKVVTGTGPEPTRFLKSTKTDILQRSDRLPFEHAWKNPDVDLAKYKFIVVRPVTTAYLHTEQWEESKSTAIPTKRAYQRKCNALAAYWTKSLSKSFSSPVCMFYKTTDTNQPGTIVLEIALTEVRFPRSASAGEVATTITGPPRCAFELRSRDGSTGKLINTAADRRGPEIKVVESKTSDISASNKAICDEWSQQLMQLSNVELFPKVKRSWFSIF